MTLYEQIETNGDLKIKVDKIVAEIRAEKYTGDSLELEKTLDSLGGLSLQKFHGECRKLENVYSIADCNVWA
eukprot:COSAG01_NODE_44933_length_414_cov_0.819048_1_plen_71_part_10